MASKKKNKTATLRDVAEVVGCSVNTVSLALRGSARIGKETRILVLREAKKLGYVPNYAARNLITRRSGMIGVYTGGLYDAVRIEMTNCLIENLHTAEYRPVLGLGQRHAGPWHDSPWMKTFQALNVEAIVIVSDSPERLPVWAARIPIILVGSQPKRTLRCDCLGLDRKEAARLGIEHLLSRGHRDILVASSAPHPFTQGCRKALRAAGCKERRVDLTMPLTDTSRAELLECVLSQKDQLSAVILSDSGVAVELIHELSQRKIKVPEDIAVLAYDYLPLADKLKVPLTTIEQPIKELMTNAVDVIKARLSEPDKPFIHKTLSHRLMVRESTSLRMI